MNIKEAFGRAIRARRAELNMSQENLALTAHIAISFMSGVERGSRQPGLEKTADIARALGLKASELWARAEVIQQSQSG